MFNRLFAKISRFKPSLLRIWFNCGIVFGSISMVVSVVILMIMLYKSLKDSRAEQVFVPVVSCAYPLKFCYFNAGPSWRAPHKSPLVVCVFVCWSDWLWIPQKHSTKFHEVMTLEGYKSYKAPFMKGYGCLGQKKLVVYYFDIIPLSFFIPILCPLSVPQFQKNLRPRFIQRGLM